MTYLTFTEHSTQQQQNIFLIYTWKSHQDRSYLELKNKLKQRQKGRTEGRETGREKEGMGKKDMERGKGEEKEKGITEDSCIIRKLN